MSKSSAILRSSCSIESTPHHLRVRSRRPVPSEAVSSLRSVARCTAPVEGHRSSAAAARCPACRGSYGRRRSYSHSPPSYYSPPAPRPSSGRVGGASSIGGGATRSKRSTRSGRVTGVAYTEAEWRAVRPAYEKAEEQAAKHPERHDVFLCHAWDDREGAAKDLYDKLVARGVSVWFSDKAIVPGTPLLRAIDKGLATSRIGIVLATPALLKRLQAQGIVDKELSVLLATDRVIPIAHQTDFDKINEVSPMLASRAGWTSDGTLDDMAAKIADAVNI